MARYSEMSDSTAVLTQEQGAVEERLLQMQALVDLAQRFVQAKHCEDALRLLLDHLEEVVGIQGFELLAAARNDSLLSVASSFKQQRRFRFDAIRDAYVGSDCEPSQSALAKSCLRSNATQVHVKGDEAPARLHPFGDACSLDETIQSTLACPVEFDGQVAAVLLLYSSVPDGFDSETFRRARAMCVFLASVLQRHRGEIDGEQSQDVLRRVIDSTGQWIGLIDFHNRIALTNEAYSHHLCQVTGLPIDEITVDTEFLNQIAEPFVESAALSETLERWLCSDCRNRDAFLTRAGRYLEFQVIPVRELGHLLIITDVTSERRHENALRDAANTAQQVKSNFLANMSHEIRTPMTAILGFADVLLDCELAEAEQQSALQTIQDNGQHLMSVINDILDISKVEAGKLVIDREPVNLSEVLVSAIELAKPLAERKGLSVRVAFETPTPATIETDAIRLRQVLVNLLSNAVKFTNRGCVDVAVRYQEGTNEQSNRLWFRVTDTGIGMTSEESERLFTPFCQADESATRRFGGAGIGLQVSRSLARLLGGELSLYESVKGVGSSFEFTIDPGNVDGAERIESLQDCSHPIAPTPFARTLPPCRVLLAEDGPDNQRLIRHLLLKAGAKEVAVAENGREAVERAVEEQPPFDLILMDMQMPEMDGYAATEALRKRGYNRPILALTAHAMSDDRAKCLNAGCDDYAAKPIDKGRLVSAIHTLLDAKAP